MLCENFELFMFLWSSVKVVNVMFDEDFENNVKILKNIGDKLVLCFVFGRFFKEMVEWELEGLGR